MPASDGCGTAPAPAPAPAPLAAVHRLRTCPGIDGNVDADTYYGDLAALRHALLGAPTEEEDLTKEEFKDAWRELTAQGIIHGQDSWADGFRVYKDELDQIQALQRQTNAKLDRIIDLLEAQPPVP